MVIFEASFEGVNIQFYQCKVCIYENTCMREQNTGHDDPDCL